MGCTLCRPHWALPPRLVNYLYILLLFLSIGTTFCVPSSAILVISIHIPQHYQLKSLL